MVLVGRDGCEGGLRKHERLEVVRVPLLGGVRGGLRGKVDHVEARLVSVHRVQDDLEGAGGSVTL